MLARMLTIVCLAAVMLFPGPVAAQGDSSFIGLGFLPGGWDSSASAVSGDGSTVVGRSSSSNGVEAFRWRAATGMQGLGDFAGGPFASEATAVSFDGNAVAGYGTASPPPGCEWFCLANRAFRWTPNGGLKKLINDHSFADAISGAGGVVVGSAVDGAFRWSGNGPNGLQYVDPLPGDAIAQARAISADATVICGTSLSTVYRPVRWVGGPVPALITDAPGFAEAISNDGTTIVGGAFDGLRHRAYRWTEDAELVWLPDLVKGRIESHARAVSGDGSVIIGTAASSVTEYTVFIWDAEHGMRDLREVLEGVYGLDLTGWTLGAATGIAADGRTIVGYGSSPEGLLEAWLARLGTPRDQRPQLRR